MCLYLYHLEILGLIFLFRLSMSVFDAVDDGFNAMYVNAINSYIELPLDLLVLVYMLHHVDC